jgi:thiol-disulfide isomerase/thioredoxin
MKNYPPRKTKRNLKRQNGRKQGLLRKKDTRRKRVNKLAKKKVRFQPQPAENYQNDTIKRIQTPYPVNPDHKKPFTTGWNKFNTDILNYDSHAKREAIVTALNKGTGKVIYGYFWMDGCGYCIHLHPIWATVVEEMRMKHPEYFDADFRRENMDEAISVVSEKYKPTPQISVDSYPTIFLIKNGKLQYYEGERTKDAIVNWVITRPV